MLPTDILGMLSSNLIVGKRSGGDVTDVQMANCTAGLLPSVAEVGARAARSAQAEMYASTTLYGPRRL